MGLLLLLTSTLLCSWRPVNPEPIFQIDSVTLFIEPRADVVRNTNVTLRCHAKVITSGQEALSREYTIYKDDSLVYNKTTSSSEDFLYHLPEAKVFNNGRYKCRIKIREQQMPSDPKTLTVTGLSLPVFHLNKAFLTEGEDVTVRCSAPGETGSIFFYFYDDDEEVHVERLNSNQAEAKLRVKGVGSHTFHCSYTVLILPDSIKSNKSNTVFVTVEELSIVPILDVSPLDNVYEGDRLSIKCSFRASDESFKGLNLLLTQGTTLLSYGEATAVIDHNMTAEATASTLTFECRLTMGNVVKVDPKTISVTELFSAPTLTMIPPEVFQMEQMKLSCNSQRIAAERLNRGALIYSLDPAEHSLTQTETGVFSGKALKNDFNYTCVAEAKGIKKRSKTLTVRPKVPVSVPDIWVSGQAVLGKPVRISCQSKAGSPPITYTLWRDRSQTGTFRAKLLTEEAHFQVNIDDTKELNLYSCKANNGGREDQQSSTLNATVIEPLTKPFLFILPNPADISEGKDLYLICSVKGTPPVTFRWFHRGERTPVKITTSATNHSNYHITDLSKEHSGTYRCEAENRANIVVQSDLVSIEVRMALWKKALIGGVLLLVASLLLMAGCILYHKHRRGKRETSTELSVKPASPKSDDSLTVTLTHDTEVINAATVMVSRTADSVWSDRKPEPEIDDEFSTVSNEPEVEYTEVVHLQSADPGRAPLRKGTDTIYSELQNSPHGAAEHHDYGSVKYAELNGEQPEISQRHTEELPVPLD